MMQMANLLHLFQEYISVHFNKWHVQVHEPLPGATSWKAACLRMEKPATEDAHQEWRGWDG